MRSHKQVNMQVYSLSVFVSEWLVTEVGHKWLIDVWQVST